MARGLDHIVHAVRDLDAAVDLYRRLGFQVGSRNRHPKAWGTQNHIIQFPGTYVELLSLADTSEMVPHTPRHFSFGAFNRDFLTRQQGLSMLVLEGHGASDTEEFLANRLGDFALYEFTREGKRPDGAPVKLAFSLAFASDPEAPDIGFFTSQQHNPESFWNPEFQVHANTARRVAGVVLVAEDPARHVNFLCGFTGVDKARTSGDAFVINTPRGDIEVTTPAAFLRRFGASSPAVFGGRRKSS
jgi:catechol 2,3-dioxygenase-like lactoylglutathione lyase family enzyme